MPVFLIISFQCFILLAVHTGARTLAELIRIITYGYHYPNKGVTKWHAPDITIARLFKMHRVPGNMCIQVTQSYDNYTEQINIESTPK